MHFRNVTRDVVSIINDRPEESVIQSEWVAENPVCYRPRFEPDQEQLRRTGTLARRTLNDGQECPSYRNTELFSNGFFRFVLVLTALLWFVLPTLTSSAFARELLTFDGSLKDQFTPLSKSRLEAWSPDEAKLNDIAPMPRGRAVRVTAPAGGGFVTNADVVAVEWNKVESLGLWLHRSAAEAKEHPTVELEVRLIEADRKAYFWRRIEIAHVGWQKLLLPLDWFVWSDGRIPRWDNVKYIGFRLRDEGAFTLDTIWTEQASDARTEFAPTERLARVAFPKPLFHGAEDKSSEASSLRTLETRDVQLLTNAKSLDLERLAAHCGMIAKQVREELPFLTEPRSGSQLIIFEESAEYRRFITRHARQLKVLVNVPDTPGFTFQGVSSSFWDADLGTLRPVFAHEFLHGYLSRTTRFPCHGEWLHEGLATYFQLKFHPQANLDQLVRDGLSSPKKHVTLKELCNGQHISLTQYWQAGTLCQMLLTEPNYRSKLATLFERLEAAGSTDLGPHLDLVWQTDWEKLTADWRAFCERKFPKK